MDDEPSRKTGLTRRDFFTHAGKTAVAATGVCVAAGSVRLAIPNVEAGRPRRLLLGSPADFKMRTVTWLAEHELFVLRTEDGFGAFSSSCTHLGCTVRRVADGFVCPCHGARYDPQGRVQSGPAREPLTWLEVRLTSDDKLWAFRDHPVLPGTFSASESVK